MSEQKQEYTTIRIRVDQKWVLDDLKVSESESYESVVQRLIDAHERNRDRDLTEDDVRDIVRAEVVPEALR